jgi:urease accessory protein UreF
MTADPTENNTWRAANKAIKTLQQEVKDAKLAARWRRLQVMILAVVSTVLILVCTGLGWTVYQIHADAVNACRQANASRSESTQIWNYFIDLALQGNPDPSAKQKGAQLKQFAAQVDAPHNCVGVYHILGTSGN